MFQTIDIRADFIPEGQGVSVKNSVTPVPTGLEIPVQVGATYLVKGYLTVSADVASGLLLNAGNSKCSVQGMGLNTWAWNGSTLESQVNGLSLTQSLVASTNVITVVVIEGIIFVEQAGTFGLQFAQNVAGATATAVFPGSYLQLTRVS